MNVFHKITRAALLKNRVRTTVTVIGIILSMALFTAVIEGAYSGVQFLLRNEIESSGKYHAFYYDVTEKQVETLKNCEDIEEYATWNLVGWCYLDTDFDEFHPYGTVVSISDNFPDLVSTKILEGRLPETENEIMIPMDLRSLANETYSVGDQISLPVGKRMAGGKELGIRDVDNEGIKEEITDTTEKEYTIVGVYQRLDYKISAYAGYLLLTKGPAEGEMNVFFTLKDIRKFYTEFVNDQPIDGSFATHDDIFLYNGLSKNDSLMMQLYGFVAILVFLISFGSISLIYNSFAISVSERTKQFGVLRSLGATKRQIRRSVFYEAFVLAGIGIPFGLIIGCTGIGVTLYFLRDAFSRLVGYGDSTVKIGLVLNPLALFAAALICLLTVVISAWIPAKRTSSVNAIEAIRQVQDMKIRGKEVKTSKLTQKLFGFEGTMAAKNFKRNRKSYRSTIVSLFVSIVLFISSTSFCSYLTRSFQVIAASRPLTDITYYTVGDKTHRNSPQTVFSILSSATGVTDGLYMDYDIHDFLTEFDNLDTTYIHKPYDDLSQYNETIGTVCGYIVFIDDHTFRSICKENNLDAKMYFTASHPVGVIYNNGIEMYQEKENAPWKWYVHKMLDEKKFPCTLTHRTHLEYDGYEFYAVETEANGAQYNIYYPTEYLEGYFTDESDGLDESFALKLPTAVSSKETKFTVNAAIQETPFALKPDTPAIIFPYSMERYVIGDDSEEYFGYETYFNFRSENHYATYADMQAKLKDNGLNVYHLHDGAGENEFGKTFVTVVKVFSYGFIILISLIAIANVFNTISTNISIRRREFAMLKSVGLSNRGFRKMMNYECIIYGLKGIIYGLPAAILVTFIIYRVTGTTLNVGFYIPWRSVVIAVGSVFIVVFATMIYSTGKIKNDNPIDALRNENV